MSVERATVWLPLAPSDLVSVTAIAERIHPGLPERPEVFAEKIALFAAGCRRLVRGSETVGYGIAHPWMLHSVPPRLSW
ncbi:MAG TPA: hypothetical protein VHE79_14455 [Spirochaetia bacterium]